MTKSKIDIEPIYNVKDLQTMFGIGKDNAYRLMHKVGFPVSAKSLRVRHSVLFKYLEREVS